MSPHTLQILLSRLDKLGFGPWHDDFIAIVEEDPPTNTEGFVRWIFDAEGMGEDADLHLTRQVRDLVAELLQAEVQADKDYLDHFYDDRKERTKEVEG